jgi:hypothetical protein
MRAGRFHGEVKPLARAQPTAMSYVILEVDALRIAPSLCSSRWRQAAIIAEHVLSANLI